MPRVILQEQVADGRGERTAWLDVGRGVSIVLVVFYHVIMLFELHGLPFASVYDKLNGPMQLVRMPLFFTMSALLISSRLALPWRQYANRYLLPTAWLFLVWNSLYLLTKESAPWSQILTSIYTVSDLITHLWFLWALVLFRCLAKLLAPVRHMAIVVAMGLSIAGFQRLSGTADLTFAELNILKYAFFFLAAVWYGRPLAQSVERRPWLWVAAAGAGMGLSWIVYIKVLVAVTGVFSAAAVAVLIARHLPRLSSGLTWLGRRSLEIFLLHFAFITWLLPLTEGLPGSVWWATPCVMLAAIAGSLAIRPLAEPFAPWLFELPKWRTAVRA
ncbi:acyltransferase family protein [Frigidibacter sp. MR17.14]|uniref:acyltransferase family protein n=1 Tax=Frigidibacter sp. MR17.14 TaxID=3126509 RepID=UPI0030131217